MKVPIYLFTQQLLINFVYCTEQNYGAIVLFIIVYKTTDWKDFPASSSKTNYAPEPCWGCYIKTVCVMKTVRISSMNLLGWNYWGAADVVGFSLLFFASWQGRLVRDGHGIITIDVESRYLEMLRTFRVILDSSQDGPWPQFVTILYPLGELGCTVSTANLTGIVSQEQCLIYQ